MDNQKQNIIIALAIATVLLVSFLLLFEYVDTPDTIWNKSYKYDSKEPYGAYVFKRLLEDAVGIENVITLSEDQKTMPIDTNQLYIMLGHYAKIDSEKSKYIDSILNKNGDVLLISNFIYGANEQCNQAYDQILYNYKNESTIDYDVSDSLHYLYKHREKNIENSTKTTIVYFHKSTFVDQDYYHIAGSIDSQSIFITRCLDKGRIYHYSIPYHFSNIASTEADFLSNFNQVFSRFSPSSIILDHPSTAELIRIKHGQRKNGDGAYQEDFKRLKDESQSERDSGSPIQYVLSQPALKWAYYLTLLAMILFALFRGKRKQRIIPVAEKNDNTSIEYVDTISHLFQAQNQNSKLVSHIEDIFHQKVKKKYFIGKQHKSFTTALSNKSKVDEKEINVIMNIFKNAHDGYTFTDDQLHILHKKLESFYQNWK